MTALTNTAPTASPPSLDPVDLDDADHSIEIGAVGWEGYLRSCRARSERSRPKMIYRDGDLTLVSSGQPRERLNVRLGMFFYEVVAGLRIHFRSLGQPTWRRRKDFAVEGDQTYDITSEPLIRPKPKVDLRVEPPPDLAIEVVHTHKADHALEVYGRLGVPEVWVCDKNRVAILARQPHGTYNEVDQSLALSFLSATGVHAQIQQPPGTSDLDFTDGVRRWVQEVLVPRVPPI